MQKIIYVPPNGNDETDRVVLALEEPYLLSEIKGLGGAENTIISSDIAGVQGSVYHGFRKSPRVIDCTVYVCGKSRADMYRERLRLIGLLKPSRQPGTAYYSNDYISVKIPAVVSLPPDFVKRIKNYNQAALQLWCPDPDWLSLETKTVSIAAMENIGFTLPFSFPISFSHINNQVTVNNEGTASAPVIITITGPGENPAVINLTNGQKIALNRKTLASDEQLMINTEKGKKSVRLLKNGIITDAFQYIDPVSKFWELEPGKNEIRYSSDDNAEATRITITFTERYEGV